MNPLKNTPNVAITKRIRSFFNLEFSLFYKYYKAGIFLRIFDKERDYFIKKYSGNLFAFLITRDKNSTHSTGNLPIVDSPLNIT